MNVYPYQIASNEPTKKQVWLAAMTSLLCHMQPEEAVEAADRALALCDERWREPGYVRCWQYEHNFGVGHQFVDLVHDENRVSSSEQTEPER
jgi:hypothetical protein